MEHVLGGSLAGQQLSDIYRCMYGNIVTLVFSTDVEKKIKFLQNGVQWAEYSNTCDLKTFHFFTLTLGPNNSS